MTQLAEPNLFYFFRSTLCAGLPIIDFEDCKMGNNMGCGKTLKVHDGTCKLDGDVIERSVAFKVPRGRVRPEMRDRAFADVLSCILQEIRLTSRARPNPFVIDFYGLTFQAMKPVLIVELAIGTLGAYLEDNDVSWIEKLCFLYEIALGLSGLHKYVFFSVCLCVCLSPP